LRQETLEAFSRLASRPPCACRKCSPPRNARSAIPASRDIQNGLFDAYEGIHFALADLRVHSHGTIARATFIFRADLVSKRGASSHLDGRRTTTFEKRAGHWIVVHEHVSAPLNGSYPAAPLDFRPPEPAAFCG
jgi:ketosteroid isomerase-like protein